MRLPRLSTRRLMVVVAVAALALAYVAEIPRRAARFRKWADLHDELRSLSFKVSGADELFWCGNSPASELDIEEICARENGERAGHLVRIAFYHAKLSVKYYRAAERPWLPVPPDPPEPR